MKQYVVPLLKPLSERRRKRLGLDQLYYFDGSLSFVNGNAQAVSDRPLVEVARQVHQDLSPETATFFDFMDVNDRMDLESRPAKLQGGYNAPFLKQDGSFVLTNFNGTNRDVGVLTHELGHAFQTYQSKDIAQKSHKYLNPSIETAEIHSMGMEYFAWDWYPVFFGGDSLKYQYQKITDALHNLTPCCIIDEFQEFIYQHPNAIPIERHQKHSALLRTYLP